MFWMNLNEIQWSLKGLPALSTIRSRLAGAEFIKIEALRGRLSPVLDAKLFFNKHDAR